MCKLYKFNENVVTRYESRIDDGMYFLFNVANNELWTGNTSSYVLLNNFKQKMSIKLALDNSFDNFDLDYSELENVLVSLVNDLVARGFVDSYDE
jgi:hypothetical protein